VAWTKWSYAPHVPETHDRTFADSGKEVRDTAGQPYVLEEAIRCDAALVYAWIGDRHGNLVYRESAQNFNPLRNGRPADDRRSRTSRSG
jgi:acyl CoA:acetate/3-ketoacid CoA transferase alpha subunit